MGHLLMQRTATWPTCFILWCLSVQLLLLSPVYSLNQSSCNPDDYGALEGFLRGVTGGISGWTLSNTTSEVANRCAWVGVTCDAGGRVIRLDLHGRKLKGELAPSLAQLGHLQWLNLSDNNLRGAIPAPRGNLDRTSEKEAASVVLFCFWLLFFLFCDSRRILLASLVGVVAHHPYGLGTSLLGHDHACELRRISLRPRQMVICACQNKQIQGLLTIDSCDLVYLFQWMSVN